MCLSPSSLQYFQQTTRFIPNFTGQVFKTEPYNFASGGNNKLWKGKLMHEDSKDSLMVAVIVIKRLENPAIAKRLSRDMYIWSTVIHPNITPLLGVSFDFDRPQMPCLVLPYYRHRDIRKYIKNQPGANKFALISQVASGLEYLHARSIIHGDIQPNHVLVNDKGEASITDFSLSRILDATEFTTAHAIPPEVLEICQEEEFNPSTARGWRGKAPERMAVSPNEADESIPRVTKTTDVWEFGMTILEILTETIPFSHIKSNPSVIHFIVTGGRPNHARCSRINNEIWKMLEECWSTDPTLRPTMRSLFTFFDSQATSYARLLDAL